MKIFSCILGSTNSNHEALKITKETRGARQLREHELSYFGVQVNSMDNNNNNKFGHRRLTFQTQSSINNTNGLRQRSLKTRNRNNMISQNDLNTNLNVKSLQEIDVVENDRKLTTIEHEEPIYENIANDITPIFTVKQTLPMTTSYNRTADLERDALILEEMNRNANQTLKVRINVGREKKT